MSNRHRGSFPRYSGTARGESMDFTCVTANTTTQIGFPMKLPERAQEKKKNTSPEEAKGCHTSKNSKPWAFCFFGWKRVCG